MDLLTLQQSTNYSDGYNANESTWIEDHYLNGTSLGGNDPVAFILGDENVQEPSSESLLCTLLSVECECHSIYQFYNMEEKLVLGLISLPIISFGLCANILSICIFTHRVMRGSPINWYLAVLSCSDTIILFSAFFVLALPRLGEYLMVWGATSFSYTTAPYFYGLMTMAQTVSVWMTVGMSLHRYIGVCFPFQSINILRKKKGSGLHLRTNSLFNCF